jgi:hypothetical protein
MVVESSTPLACLGAYPAVGTFEVTGKGIPEMISAGPPAESVCRGGPNNQTYYEAGRALNPADVFVPLERKMSD